MQGSPALWGNVHFHSWENAGKQLHYTEQETPFLNLQVFDGA